MISRRSFLNFLTVTGGAAGLSGLMSTAGATVEMMTDPLRFGNLSLLQIGDTHAQLTPTYYREASENIGLGREANQPPYLVAEDLLEHYRVIPNSIRAHALTPLGFAELAAIYGRTGGYAHLATVINSLRSSRPDSLLLDCGNSLRGSATALWSRSADMVAATRLLGVDAMTDGMECQPGLATLKPVFMQNLAGRTRFLAHCDGGGGPDAGSALPYAIYFLAGVPVAVIGRGATMMRPLAGDLPGASGPSEPDEAGFQLTVDQVRARGARLVVLMSQAGLASDLKLVSRLSGIDVVLSGGSCNPLPEPLAVQNPGGRTLVSSVGAYGKFCGVLDLDFRHGQLKDFRFRLIPLFANLIPPHAEMSALIDHHRAPHAQQLEVKLADNEGLLYRRGNFVSSTDELTLSAMLAAKDVEVAFTPGYRWGTTMLPGEPITVERLLEQFAERDAAVHVDLLTGRNIHQRLEDWADQVFNADPYRRSGDDMVRAGGLSYRCNPSAKHGNRISQILVRGVPLKESARYRTANWRLFGPEVPEGEPISLLVANHLKEIKTVPPLRPTSPALEGVTGNRGLYGSRQ